MKAEIPLATNPLNAEGGVRNALKAESGKQKFVLAFSFPDFSFPFALAGSALLVSYLLLRVIAIDPLDEAAGLSPTSKVETADYAEGADVSKAESISRAESRKLKR